MVLNLYPTLCDCPDGSDEPGTSACPTGHFYCANAGHVPANIRSSRVNDGVCDEDCCDGTDEHDGRVTCADRCAEAAERASHEQNKALKANEEGLVEKLKFLSRAGDENKEREARILVLEKEVAEMELNVQVLLANKDEKEAREKTLRDKQKVTEITMESLAEEIRLYERWVDVLLDSIEGLTAAKGGCTGSAVKPVDESIATAARVRNARTEWEERPVEMVGEEDVKAAAAAASARTEYNDLNNKKTAKATEITELRKRIELDLGPTGAMGILEGCQEYDTPEYVYKLCFFDKAEQKAKNNGGLVSLGTWRGWTGRDLTQYSGKDLKYTETVFNGGLSCWNGPARSITVSLECGSRNEVLSVTEPNKCEYAARMTTPALCEGELADIPADAAKGDGGSVREGKAPRHDEL